MCGSFEDRDGWASFPAVDSAQLHVGQSHADQNDSQQSHLVLPEAPHGVVDFLHLQESLPWDSATRQEALRASVRIVVEYKECFCGYLALTRCCCRGRTARRTH